jgi:hypothetical protein
VNPRGRRLSLDCTGRPVNRGPAGCWAPIEEVARPRSWTALLSEPLTEQVHGDHSENATDTAHDHPGRRKANASHRHANEEVNNDRVEVDHGAAPWSSARPGWRRSSGADGEAVPLSRSQSELVPSMIWAIQTAVAMMPSTSTPRPPKSLKTPATISTTRTAMTQSGIMSTCLMVVSPGRFRPDTLHASRQMVVCQLRDMPRPEGGRLSRFEKAAGAARVGTTRSRINYFMNKFRKLGLVEYNGVLKVHSSLLNVIIRE